jgi:hypothetical protein
MKRTIVILFCFAAFAILAASCYTSKKCPAYAYHTEEVRNLN